MTTEERARFTVLLENIQTHVMVIAEGHGALTERLDRIDGKFAGLESRFDGLEMKVDALEMKVDALASDTQGRLKRIEAHLDLNGSSPRRKAPRVTRPKLRKKR